MVQRDVEHVHRAGRHFVEGMLPLTAGVLDVREFVAVAGQDDDVGYGVEKLKEGGALGGEAGPAVGLGVVAPEGGERYGGNDELEGGSGFGL